MEFTPADLEHQFIVVSSDGNDGKENSFGKSFREARQAFNEKNPIFWGSIAALRAAEALANAIENKCSDVTSISAEKASLLAFPPGHPRRKLVYARHPARADLYYPVATFHRYSFEHKFAEIIRLLSSLGATQITVEHVRGWGRGFGLDMTGATAAAGVDSKASFNTSSKNDDKVLFVASLTGHTSPFVPEGLVWYAHESMWQEIARNRLENGLKKFDLKLSYSDDFGVNASLKANITKGSLELGGKFEDHESTEWRIVGEFA